jgi:Flp pilus assembly pilin Flp
MPMAIARAFNQRSVSFAHSSGEDMKNLFARFIREEDGQDVIEYALLAAFVSTIAGTVIVGIGTDVLAMFNTTAGRLPPP